jgi:hypothetical protein
MEDSLFQLSHSPSKPISLILVFLLLRLPRNSPNRTHVYIKGQLAKYLYRSRRTATISPRSLRLLLGLMLSRFP